MLKEKIGIDAGTVFSALIDGSLELKDLRKVTKLTVKDLDQALGWLAREDKIYFSKGEGRDIYVTLS